MKILAKIKKRPYILSILFAMLLIGIVYAAEYYQVNSGAQATINEWSVCKKVTNNNALAIFVPTKTAAEWTAFRTYASGVTYAECCSANGVACSSDGNCCSAICGTNADGDAYFSSAAGHTGICQATSYPYTDCNDGNGSIWQYLTGYPDNDGDTYGTGSGQNICSGSSLPSGYASRGGDCCDTRANVRPNQGTYFTTSSGCSAPYDWDYNCSGAVEGINCTGNTQCQYTGARWLYCCSYQVVYTSCTPVTPITEPYCGDSWVQASCPSITCYTDSTCVYTIPYTTYWCLGTSRTCSCH